MLIAPALLLCVVLQDTGTALAGGPIDAEAIREHIDVLASDLFEGREAGTRGERRAAAYIVSVLERSPALRPGGPDGTWFQPFEVNGLFKRSESRNVLALLPGTDPELAAETIVIGAHYDHEGRSGLDRIYNGADDNASGSAALLEIAAALAARPEPPRHTLLFQWFGAEERGLVGSAHYVAHPTRPLAGTIFMLNLDMVGRLRGRTLMVGATGSSPLFPLLLPGLCRRHGLTMKDEPRVSRNSDHSSFFEAGVPVLFLFTGFHADYHRLSDEAQRINAPGVARIADLAVELVQAIDELDSEERPAFVAAPRGKERWTPRFSSGLVLRPEPGDGALETLRVSQVFRRGAADRAGVQVGDLVIAIDGRPVDRNGDAGELPCLDAFDAVARRLLIRRTAGATPQPAEFELLLLPELR